MGQSGMTWSDIFWLDVLIRQIDMPLVLVHDDVVNQRLKRNSAIGSDVGSDGPAQHPVCKPNRP